MKINEDNVKEITLKILSGIGTGGLVVSAVMFPGIMPVLSTLVAEETKLPRRKVHERLWNARRSGWLKIVESEKGLAVELTGKGKKHLSLLYLQQPIKQKKWDGRWRLIIFDIPDTKKKARDSLRWLLKQQSFVQLQESVWVTPWDCQAQVRAARELLGLSKELKLVLAEDFDGRTEVARHFNLKTF